jgi:hypothetical protein
MQRVVVRTPPRRARATRRAATGRRSSASCLPARGRGSLVTGFVLLLAVSFVGWLALDRRSANPPAAAASVPGWYIAVPHPATPEMKKEAAYLSRKHNLRQIEEPGASRVEIRRLN